MNAPRLQSSNKNGYTNLARVDVIAITLSQALRAQGRAKEAATVLKSNFRINKLNTAYLEAMGLACIEAGEPEEGESYLFQALVLNDTNRELSRVINTWIQTGAIPASKAPLAKADVDTETDLAPPLNIDKKAVREKLSSAAEKVDSYLKEENRSLEAARLKRAMRLMMDGEAHPTELL
jgi:tetratricopeptide (TPR) repeat protein